MVERLNTCPIRLQAQLQPDSIAIESAQQQLSFQQLDQQINALAAQLLTLGIQRGDRLICIAPNSVNLVLLQLTCLRHAFIFCPINPRFSEAEIHSRIAILASQFIWYQQTDCSLNFPSLALCFSCDVKTTVKLKSKSIDATQVIDIIFTSGSSGQPKAIMHNFSNHFYSALGSQAQIPLQKGDTNLLSLPLFHISGYATVIRTLLAGATLLIRDSRLSVKQLQQDKVTHLSLVAKQLYDLLQDTQFQQTQLNIKHLLLGGSAFSKDLLLQIRQRGFCYHLSYGLTEMSSQVATSTNDSLLTPLNVAQIRIIDDEILLRGKTRFVGYFNAQQGCATLPEETWFASKDLGRLENSQLHIIGRKDRQFICGGENIQPEEIERALLSHEAIIQAYVVAITHPSLGQQPVAFIDSLSPPSRQALDDYLSKQLSRYKRPVCYLPLAKQSTLKVSLRNLQEIAQKVCVDIDK